MTEKMQLSDFRQTVHIGSPEAPAEEIQWKLAEGAFGQGVFTMPEEMGYGRMTMSEVGPTIAYVLLELCFNRDVAVERPDFGEQRSITYCCKGSLWLLDEEGQKKEQSVGSLLYCDRPKKKPMLFCFQSGERSEWALFLLHSVGEMLPMYHYPILQIFERERERGVEFPCITRSPEIARVFERDHPSEENDPKIRRTMLSSKLVSISAILLDKGMGQVQDSVRGISPEEQEMLQEARGLLLQDFNNPPTISQIARSVGLNETKLKREFKQFYGLPVYQYLKKAKMERAMELLTSTDLSIREIAFRCGYDSQSQFTAAFRTTYHLAPFDAHKKFRNTL
jgi:AraC-like DNA-binding protein